MEIIAQFGLFNGILVLLLILAYSFRRNTNKVFLGLSLFFVWYCLLNLQLNASGEILKFPHLQRTGLIAAYLAFPFLYVYSRNNFYPGTLWRKTDWVLLIPAVIYIIDFLPFFILPPDQKIAIWKSNLANSQKMFLANEGWLGLAGFHFAFIYIWIAIIMYFQARLIFKNWRLQSGFTSAHNQRLLYFIVTITCLFLPLFVPGIFGVLFKLSWFNPKFIGFTYGLSLSAVSIYVLIFPSILYGFLPERKFSHSLNTETSVDDRRMKIEHHEPVIAKSEASIAIGESIIESSNGKGIVEEKESTEEIAAEIAIVLEHMLREKPFRKQGFTIQDLSNQTGIPVYQLSPLINGHFKMNFANWINRYRIEYFLERAPENQQMTLEALSKEAGFISRSTFISAFKKEKGVTPREYLKGMKLSTIPE